MKFGDIVDIFYTSSDECPICGTKDIDWTAGTWMCGFSGDPYQLPQGKIKVLRPCCNHFTLEQVNQEPTVKECDCSGFQLLNFGHKCSFHKNK